MSVTASATAAEHARFLAARDGDPEAASEMLASYLQWRQDVLTQAKPLALPGLCSFLPSTARCQQGHRIIVILAAMYDNTLATGEEYALAIARIIDEELPRDSDEKMTVVVDVRGGAGWANPRPWSALPFIKALAGTLQPNFPERLGKLLVMPVPWVAKGLWATASLLLDEVTANKVALLSGPAGRADPLPEELSAHIDGSAQQAFESYRQARLEDARAASLP